MLLHFQAEKIQGLFCKVLLFKMVQETMKIQMTMVHFIHTAAEYIVKTVVPLLETVSLEIMLLTRVAVEEYSVTKPLQLFLVA